MSFETNYNSLNASLRKKLKSVQVNQEISLKNDGIEISKVLSANAVPVVEDYKIEENSIVVNGAIEYSVLYEKVDGIKETITQSEQFSTVLECEDLRNVENVCLTAKLIDLAVKNISVDRINVSSLIEIYGYIVVNNEVKYLSEVSSDIFSQSENISFTKLKSKISQTYFSSQEIEISQVPLRLLNLNANGIINNVTTAKGYITISGVIEYNICYEYALEDGIDTKDISNTYNFKYELDCPNCEPTDYAVIVMNNIKDGVKCEIESKEEQNLLNLEVKFNLCGEVYANDNINIISDVFCLNKKLQLTFDSFNYSKMLGMKNYREKIYGVCEISEDSPRIDKILCVLDSNAVVTKSFCDAYNLNVEGIAYTNVIYLNAEETIESKMQIEIPFSFCLPLEKEEENCEVMVSTLLTDVMARIRHGRELEIDASIEIVSHFYLTKSGAVISNVEVSSDKIDNLSAFTIYIAKDNDSIWTIAKKMCISPDELTKQNPKLNDGINKGDKIIIYRKK